MPQECIAQVRANRDDVGEPVIIIRISVWTGRPAGIVHVDIVQCGWSQRRTDAKAAIKLVIGTEGKTDRHQHVVVQVKSGSAIAVLNLVKGVNVAGRKAEPDWKIKVTGSRGDLQAKTKKNSQQIFKFSGFHFCSFRCAREGRCMFFVVKLSPPPTGFALATLGFRLLGGLSDELWNAAHREHQCGNQHSRKRI